MHQPLKRTKNPKSSTKENDHAGIKAFADHVRFWNDFRGRVHSWCRWYGWLRASEVSGTVPGTLDPGAHMVVPLVEDVPPFDAREQIFTTGVLEDGGNRAAKRGWPDF